MKVGTSLNIKVIDQAEVDDEKLPRYRSKIIDRTDNEIMIDYPVSTDEYIDLPIQKDSEVKIEYIDQGNVYSFTAKVKRIIKSPLMSFVLDIPNKDEIVKIQRREYVRINTDVNVAVHGLDRSFTPFITVTQDISGGGTAIIVPQDVSLEDGEMLLLFLVLKSKYSDYVYKKVKAEVIRSTTVNDVRLTSLRFHFEHENNRQAIIKYCFEIQRERLKENFI